MLGHVVKIEEPTLPHHFVCQVVTGSRRRGILRDQA